MMRGNDHQAKQHSHKAFSLLESVLALAIGALVLVSLTMAFKVSRRSWTDNIQKSELIQHGRVAMARVTSDLRYAEEVTAANASTLTFNTTNLVDTDPGIEEIKYERVTPYLERSIDGNPSAMIAGSSIENITVAGFINTPLKIVSSGGDDTLVPLATGDPLSMAVAVQIDLTLQAPKAGSITVSSTVALRNK